ncbi:MAG: hypothetical protein U0174_08425 [Polyangiaceae bacterium]
MNHKRTHETELVSLREPISRREALGGILTTLGGALLLACGGSAVAAATDGGTGDAGGGGGDGGASDDARSAADGALDRTAAGEWASGGTASMTGNYPDPFPTALASCVLATAATEGPCTESNDRERRDISEGYTGLPVRLALRVVDASCNPIGGAKVKVWHTQITGSYSGDTPNPNMCLKTSAEQQKHYFRGVQTTDAAGRVDFDTCFPGWYRGRTIHIHFTVTVGGKSFTSQLVFEQSLISEIFSSHPEYKGYGQPDTPNATDNVVGNQNLATFTLETSRMADGAMLAAKNLVVPLSA